MIVPTVSDVVRTIAQSVDEVITPALEGLRERSAITTIGHMLRYVEKAVEMEGQALFDEAAKLRALLTDIAGKIEARGVEDGLSGFAPVIRAALAEQRDAAVYPSVPLLASEIRRLTQILDDSLAALHGLPETAYAGAVAAIHEQIRDYIGWQLDNEAKIIEPAFIGYGARR
jgi:hypothetical protein